MTDPLKDAEAAALPDCRVDERGQCWHSVRPSFKDEQTMPDLRARAVELLDRLIAEAGE
jgi:hypothetical protein